MSASNQQTRAIDILRAALRGVYLLVQLLLCIVLIISLRITLGKDWYLTSTGLNVTHWWMRHFCRFLGLRIYQHGSPPAQTAFYVGNHISFLDILAVLSITQLNFLSKDTVRYWPVVGYIASAIGTIFIKRGKRSLVARAIDAVCEALKQGRSVMVFPEGTTAHEKEPRKFHAGLFQAAINSKTPIQPVAIRYMREGEPDRDAAYIDNDNLLITLYRVIKRPYTEVHVSFCPLLSPEGHDRTALANMARRQIIDAFSQQLVSN